jgi:hypothetical protein
MFSPPSPRDTLPLALLTAVLTLLLTSSVHALITVGKGNDPVTDRNWPAGALDVANLKSRVGWYEGPPFGGGQWAFLYRGDTAALQAALDLFAKTNTPELTLVIHEGPGESPFLRDENAAPGATGTFDWSFTVWDPRSFHHLYNNPNTVFSAGDPNGNFRRGTVEPPRIDVFVSAGGGIDWARVTVPANLKVADERASANGYKPAAGSVLRGVVYDLVTSKPIAGASVVVAKHAGKGDEHNYADVASAKSGADGRFELTNVPPGGYRVHATADGYARRALGYETFRNDTLKEYVVRLAPPAALAGTVVDTDGKPVKGVTVRADSVMGPDGNGYRLPARAEATTDDAGAFSIAGLPQGGYCQTHARATGYSMLDVLAVRALAAPEPLRLRMTRAGTIKAKVVAPGGGPLTQTYMVQVEPEGGSKVGSWGGSGNVAADGTMAFANVPPGKYAITFRPNPGPVVQGKDPNERLIEVKGGQTVDVEFTSK